MSARDGGPAFPVSTQAAVHQEQGPYGHQDGASTWQFGGVTIRDYFAAQEMMTYRRSTPDGPLARLWDWLWWGTPVSDEEVARDCYEMADAMLEERDR